jgi:hypothetical protein
MACLNEENILECLFSLPENENDSEEDCDEDAAEELTRLEVTNSRCDERDGTFAEAVDILVEGTDPGRKNSDTTKNDESEWGDGVSYFENISRTRDQSTVIYPNIHSKTGQMAVCYQNLTLGSHSSRSAPSI